MRFDDRLETVLKIDPEQESGRVSIWRQLIDMLAQSGHTLSQEAAHKAFLALAMLRPNVPLAVRAASVRPLAHRTSYAPLVAFLANDHPQVAIACIDSARLDSAQWLSILDEIGPVGRSRLRARDDLDDRLLRALAHYGVRDFALADQREAATPRAEATGGEPSRARNALRADATPIGNDIAELVRRIDRFRAQRERSGEPSCRIRCDADGVVRAVTGVTRGRFVGLSLAQPARPTETGCDAGVARAFAKRAPISDGRIFITGDGGDAGYWRIRGEPEFDRESGRFIGYAGELRRIDPGETASSAAADAPAGGSAATGDSMRQLVHELRSPLNAISGFAQLINGQFFGPVNHAYRAIASSIMADAQQLAHALRDIDLAARLDAGRVEPPAGRALLSEVLTAVSAQLAGQIHPDATTDQPDGHDRATIAVGAADAIDIIRRLVQAILDLRSASGPLRIAVKLERQIGIVGLTVPILPALNREELDRALDHDASIAPENGTAVLGPGFGLRLAAQLARLHGGTLSIAAGQCILNLPLVEADASRFAVVGESGSIAVP